MLPREDDRHEFVQFEYSEVKAAIALDKEMGQTSYADFFKTRGTRKRTGLVTALGSFSQLSGNGLVSYYLKCVMDSVGTTTQTQHGINGGMKSKALSVSIDFVFSVDIFGCRPLYLGSTIGTAVVFNAWTIV